VTRAYLALGSNLGDRLAHLQHALDTMRATPAVTVAAVSKLYETDPVGGPEQGAFLNAVIAIDTGLDPHALLAFAHQLEQEAQRVRQEHWGPRTLDVDILLYDDAEIDDDDLTIPHPRMWERGFVLAPLRDVAPDLVDRDASWEGVRLAAVVLAS
jgi:2-amino-4-hydroxy-6-hydroxymethyldihydropteridine diphosphokinase